MQQMEQPEVFYTYEWALAVSRAYHAQLSPLLMLAYEDDSLAGLVALATNSSQEVVFLAGTTADYCDFICCPLRRRELVDLVLAKLRQAGAGMLRLANLPADSATARSLQSTAGKHGYSVFSRPAYSCAQVVIDSPDGRKSVRESAQRRVRRYRKALGRNVPVKFDHSRSRDEIRAELPAFTKAHVARFLATGRISNLAHSERRVFLDELAGSLSASGWVTLSRLLVGGQAVAWNYGFEFAGTWFWYQPTFAGSFQQYSPGLWLLSEIVAQSCESADTRRIDLGLGAEGYKERLATSSRQTLHMTVSRSASGCWKERVRYHSAAAMRSVPRVEVWARRALQQTSSAQVRLGVEGIAGCLKSLSRRCGKLLRAQSEFFLLEWSPEHSLSIQHSASPSLQIQPLDLDILAAAAMHSVHDPETLAYLVRAAERLGAGKAQGFALTTAAGVPFHLCWASDFGETSAVDFKHSMKAPSSNCALIVNCLTPRSLRRQGYYREALAGVAAKLQASGNSPWIFAAANDIAAVRGAEQAGFVKKYCLRRRRVLFASHVVESHVLPVAGPAVEVCSAA